MTHLSCIFGCKDSWKVCLRNSFKNFRRDRSSNDILDACKRSGIPEPENPKRQKLYDPFIDITEEEYEGIIKVLQEEHQRKTKYRNLPAIMELMGRSQGKRRKWILENRPLVGEILNRFPLLDTSEVVSIMCPALSYICACFNWLFYLCSYVKNLNMLLVLTKFQCYSPIGLRGPTRLWILPEWIPVLC